MRWLNYIPITFIYITGVLLAGFMQIPLIWCVIIAVLGVLTYTKHKLPVLQDEIRQFGATKWVWVVYFTQLLTALALYGVGFGLGWLYQYVMDLIG